MDASDQWWVFTASAAVVLGSYLAGRRGQDRPAIAVLCAAEAATAIALVQWHAVGPWLAEQTVLVVAVFALLAGIHRRLRHELTLRGWDHARDAGLRERARIAAELHDTLGHDLALLSLRAAGIQVTTAEPATREHAAAIRAGAADATATVRRLVDLLRAEPGVAAVLDRARVAGMRISVTGDPPADDFSSRLVTEALSNAARHAPGLPVTVVFGTDRIEVRNPLTGGTESTVDRSGSGLVTFAAQLAAVGGTLTTESTDDEFRLVARVPADVDRRLDPPPDALDRDYREHRRRARTALTTTLVAPLGLLILLATGFYAWAAHDTTIEPDRYDRLHVGMAEDAATRLLPRRQAHIRFRAAEPGCRYYTDGNYPLAYGTYEVCFADGVLTRPADPGGDSR